MLRHVRLYGPRRSGTPGPLGSVVMLPTIRTLSLLVVIVHSARAQQVEARFTSRRCLVTFSHPADWEVVADTTDVGNACSFFLRPRDWQQRRTANDGVDVYTILARIVAQDVWSAVPKYGFERRSAGWVVLGRQGIEQPADTVSGTDWRGVRGAATVGCFREDGTYAGLCDAPTAVVGTASRSLVLVAGPRSEDILDRILATLRFQR